MGWLEITLLALGAVSMAANQAVKDADGLTARFQWLRARAWWNYVPFGFVMLAGLVFVARQAMPLMTPISTSRVAQVASSKSDSGVTLTGVDLERFLALGKARTTLETQLLREPFRGAPVTVAGPILDLREGSVELGREGGREYWLSFYRPDFPPASRNTKGDRIKAKCSFEGASKDVVYLRECKIVEPD